MPNSLNDRSQSRSQFRRAAIENLEGRRLFAADGMILADVQPPAAEGLLLPAVQKLVGDGSINDSGNKGRDVADGHAKDKFFARLGENALGTTLGDVIVV
ncbi:MAG: hypothetical protein AAF802_05885 [Planctomycetota bacterium]